MMSYSAVGNIGDTRRLVLISLYLGSSAIASSYGAAGSLIVVLLWIYYSAQIFLFGPEFKKVYASYHGSHQSARHELLQQDC
jgi:membrane protein